MGMRVIGGIRFREEDVERFSALLVPTARNKAVGRAVAARTRKKKQPESEAETVQPESEADD